ncbi:hypothetical protein NUU61_003583 [Penicillium alfredii]|uniref:Uncharacterized protein n=1 Tax=Penicillium alfredii TaxID=1506179 RepID=A0A9W9FJH1_9EURO|nr:uncharacterized protein NUU61_003583 [Penicillium alfredii]KAJ5101361.1 hypothetical protein NUU61_003583 [Penicillium alfredii]
MKFSVATIAGFASAISAASLPAAFTLVADGGATVLTDGEHAFIGANATKNEILILRGNGENSPVSFTSKNAKTPTAFQSLYVVDKSVEPVGLTVPHSGAVPEGGSTTGFGVNKDGYFTHNGNAWFAVDGYGENPVKEIYWYGAHNSEYKAANLWVKECKGC